MQINFTASDNLLVGIVKEIKGTNTIIRMFENSNQIFQFYNGKKYSGVMIGSYIGIKRGQYTIVAKVEKEYAFDRFNDIKDMSFSKERFIREIEAKIIGSFKDGVFRQGIVAFPQVFNDVILLSADLQSHIINDNSISKNFPLLSFGNIWPDGTDFKLNWATLFNSHIAIFGNTGSGKSHTLAKLYAELFELHDKEKINLGHSKFIFIDFNGEYTNENTIYSDKEVIKLSTTHNEEDNLRSKLQIPYKLFWDNEMLSVLFGATEQTQKPFLTRVINFYFKTDFKLDNYLNKAIAKGFEDVYSSPNKYSLDLLKNIIKEIGYSNDYISSWIDKTKYNSTNESFYSDDMIKNWESFKNKYYLNEDSNLIKTESENIERSLRNLSVNNTISELKIAIYLNMIFELRRKTIQYDHIAPLIHRVEARSKDFNKIFEISNSDNILFNNKNLNVVSLRDVNQDMKLLVPLVIAKVTYKNNKDYNTAKNYIYNLIIDEAHNILSEKSNRETEKWKDYRLDVFEEIIKEGRKFGYYLTIASQRPADISETVVSQIHNYFIHRLVNYNDLKLLDKTMSTLDQVSKDNIPNLSVGQLICTGTSFKLPLTIQVDELNKERSPTSETSELRKLWYHEKRL
ncbi:ATP-binding protein [Mammaliicoccus lentus]|uniref:ATP-binding protein n=1 Tax=Mammaliicoccus lentus TaxID=42858 RepID=UPI001C4F75B7|nr:ATP-binding protein [Mammaliicoccus lentus]MBW0762236.1 ATP-binding protein [Mammaliicoccus lentus]